MNRRREPMRTSHRVTIMLMVVSAVMVWVVLTMPYAFAQEPSGAPAGTAPDEAKPAETPMAEAAPHDLFPDISGLLMQPVYMVIRVPVATVGAVVGAVLWAAGGGDQELAHKAWDPTIGEPWGWPDYLRGLGGVGRVTP